MTCSNCGNPTADVDGDGRCFDCYIDAGGATVASASHTSWAPLPLDDVLAGGTLSEPPEILRREDGPALIYRAGKIHSFHAEPEALKSWLMLVASAEVIKAGERALYIDFEDSPASVAGRLLALGLPAELITSHFIYVRPDEALTTAAIFDLEAILDTRPGLAVLDGLTEAFTMQGLNPLDNVDIANWLELLPRRIARRDIPVCLLDHVVKDKEQRGRYAIGGQHKLAGVDVAYSMRVIEPFGHGREGKVSIRVEKDRPGRVREHAHNGQVALLRAVSTDAGVSMHLQPPEEAAVVFRPTTLMERVSQALVSEPGLSKRAIRDAVTGKNNGIDRAIDVLIVEGYVEVRADGQARRHYSLRVFDSTVPECAPVPHRAPTVPQAPLDDRAPVPLPIGTGTAATLNGHADRAPEDWTQDLADQLAEEYAE